MEFTLYTGMITNMDRSVGLPYRRVRIALLFIALQVLFGSDLRASSRSVTYVMAVSAATSFDPDLPELQFAAADSQRFIEVMRKTGQVQDAHIWSVQHPTKKALVDQFRKLTFAGKARFIFYFSGHADAGGIHLQDGKLSRDLLHQLISQVSAHTKVVIMDSCYSGALAKKGVGPATKFQIPQAEFDEPTGSVFLAATSGDDLAFEVDELGGSLFTHHLVSGLYGQADSNTDGLVTIDEIYQHVYREMTLQKLAMPELGQKPEFQVDLSGRGALVLAEVRKNTVKVRIQPDIIGQIVFSVKGGLQRFRVDKPSLGPLELRLPPGVYQIHVRDIQSQGEGDIVISPENTVIARGDLVWRASKDYTSLAKGQRQARLVSAMVGFHSGYQPYAEAGPALEALVATSGLQLRYIGLRLFGGIDASQNRLAYKGADGDSSSASLLLGTRVEHIPKRLRGATLAFSLGIGAGYFWQKWDESAERSFHRETSKVLVGLGTSWVTEAGWAWGLEYRRQWLFVTDRSTNDVLALGANVFGFSLLF